MFILTVKLLYRTIVRVIHEGIEKEMKCGVTCGTCYSSTQRRQWVAYWLLRRHLLAFDFMLFFYVFFFCLFFYAQICNARLENG